MGKPGPKRIEHQLINGVEYKYCGKCFNWKPVTEFNSNNTKWDKLHSPCKSCTNIDSKQWHKNNQEHHREYLKQWHENHPEYLKQWRENHPNNVYFISIKHSYGITREEWVNLYQSLDGKCAICGNPFKNQRDCHTDHNHTTGQIRQLLCSNCNKLIGRVYEDVSILASMINYLKAGTYDYTYFDKISATANGKLITRNICISQEWACAVCGKSLIDTRVCLDHDNKLIENNIRGCLCNNCNLALGFCHDDIEIIRSAISYLNHWELQYYLDEAIQDKNVLLTH